MRFGKELYIVIERTFDHDAVEHAMKSYVDKIVGFHPHVWLTDESNVALTDGRNYSLFERELPHVVTGHYFFLDRGKEAISIAKEMLREAFNGDYNIDIIRGLTPLENLGARWMSKHIGFTSYGVVQTMLGPCELVILTKKEWEEQNG